MTRSWRPARKSFDYVLANPPFGKKSSMSFTNEEGEQETDDLTYNRQDFLGDDVEQAAQFRAAHPHDAEDDRPRRRCRSRQRPI